MINLDSEDLFLPASPKKCAIGSPGQKFIYSFVSYSLKPRVC